MLRFLRLGARGGLLSVGNREVKGKDCLFLSCDLTFHFGTLRLGKKKKGALAGGSGVSVAACALKGLRFNSQSRTQPGVAGSIPGPGRVPFGRQPIPVSLSLRFSLSHPAPSFPSTLSKNNSTGKISLGEDSFKSRAGELGALRDCEAGPLVRSQSLARLGAALFVRASPGPGAGVRVPGWRPERLAGWYWRLSDMGLSEEDRA